MRRFLSDPSEKKEKPVCVLLYTYFTAGYLSSAIAQKYTALGCPPPSPPAGAKGSADRRDAPPPPPPLL